MILLCHFWRKYQQILEIYRGRWPTTVLSFSTATANSSNTLSLSDCTLNSVWWHSDADDVDADDLEVEAEDEGSDVDDMGDPFDSASD